MKRFRGKVRAINFAMEAESKTSYRRNTGVRIVSSARDFLQRFHNEPKTDSSNPVRIYTYVSGHHQSGSVRNENKNQLDARAYDSNSTFLGQKKISNVIPDEFYCFVAGT